MNRRLLITLIVALMVGSAFGAKTPVVAYTFVCNGQQAGPCPDGNGANSLIQGSDGNFYGTAVASGIKATGETIFGGTIFSLTPTGKFTLLYTFVPGAKNNFVNGFGPVSLTEGPDGNLYGTTVSGGNDYNTPFLGYGVLFRISKTGSGFKVLHRFCSVGVYCSDGTYPAGSLVVGTDGNLYGATQQGGTDSSCPGGGCGTIFRVTPSSGAYEVVYSFNLFSDGELPQGLTLAPDGTFYGMTNEGGKLFHYAPATAEFQSTALSFPFPKGCPGLACFATSVLALGSNGNLYGFYTVYGSSDTGLFEVQTNGSNLRLHPALSSGVGPELLLGSDGNFWFPSYGVSGYGDIVSLSHSGTVLQNLALFGPSNPVGAYPAVLIQAKDGKLWGATSANGKAPKGHRSSGTVFSLDVGLAPR